MRVEFKHALLQGEFKILVCTFISYVVLLLVYVVIRNPYLTLHVTYTLLK